MRVLLTGATGFLGAYVLRRLLAENIEVAILIRAKSDPWRISSLLGQVTRITGDFSCAQELVDPIREFAPDATIHLAWSGVGGAYRNDQSQVNMNLVGSTALLKVVADAGCKAWIGLGSQAEYGPANTKIDENHFPDPTTLYGAAKLSTYLISKQICQQVGMRFVWMRLFSAYGPGDDANFMIPSLIKRLIKGEHIPLTEGTQLWDYIFVSDVADAVSMAAINSDVCGAFNLGSGKVQSIRAIAEQVRDLVDPNAQLGFGEVPFRSDQVMHLQADITRLQEALSWSPTITLESGLSKTVQWYMEHQNG